MASTDTITIKCNVCGNSTQLKLVLEPAEVELWKRLVLDAWQAFLQWNLVGQPEYGIEQHWFDNRHWRVEAALEANCPSGHAYISIQVYNSPNRIDWLHVKVPVRYGWLDITEWETRITNEPFNPFKERDEEAK